jgi:hypothetical protein
LLSKEFIYKLESIGIMVYLTKRATELFKYLVGHPTIRTQVDRGLSGDTFLDHIVGLTEKAIPNEEDSGLQRAYKELQSEASFFFGQKVFSPLSKLKEKQFYNYST